MKKKLIAAAVASLAASGASSVLAQNVTMYGVLDVGEFKISGHSAGLNNVNNFFPTSQSGRGLINSFGRQGTSTNHIGWRGIEDLGGGLYAGFDLQLSNLDMSNGNPGLAFGRESHLKLGSKQWGDLKFGRTISTACSVGCSYDYNYIGAGSAAGLTGLSPASFNASSRRSDLIEWTSVPMNGFTARLGVQQKGDLNNDATFATSGGAAYTTSSSSAGTSTTAGNYKAVTAIALSYAQGPLRAGAMQESAATDSKALRANRWAGVEYDFKVLKANVQYSQNSNIGGTAVPTAMGTATTNTVGQYAWHSTAGTTYGKGYVVAVVAPVATGLNVGVQYADNTEQQIKATELFAQYSLSKRTTVYAVNTKLRGTTAVTAAATDTASNTIGRSAVAADPGIFGIGLRHTF
jgi:hypothetical protein